MNSINSSYKVHCWYLFNDYLHFMVLWRNKIDYLLIIARLLGHCIVTWYAVSQYLVKLIELAWQYSDLIVIVY